MRIIVLDSSPTSRKILEVILRREGHQVASFGDARDVLRFLSQHGPADLLFLGLELPRMDGYDVLQYLRGEARFHSMGTIALLNERDGVLVRLKARLAGAQQVVTKPLVRQRIITLVCDYADRSEGKASISTQEASQRAVSASLEDSAASSRLERNGTGGAGSSRTL